MVSIPPNASGIGLRLPHLAEMVATRPRAAWLEIHPENFLANAHASELLSELAPQYPISIHSVGISIGSEGGLDRRHLKRVRALADRTNAVFVSGHLAWSTHNETYLNDLLPLPYNLEALRVAEMHIRVVQDELGRPYLVENASSYLGFTTSTMTEVEFLCELVRRTGCHLLCDVSNIHVSAHNMDFNPWEYIDTLPAESIDEFHLGGYTPEDGLLLDTHGAPIADRAWDLYAYALRRLGPKPTLIEWDSDLPALDILLGEAARADEISAQVADREGCNVRLR